MKVVDLSLPLLETPPADGVTDPSVVEQHWHLHAANGAYTAAVYDFRFNGMSSTYLDFPGHIVETATGVHAGNAPVGDLYRQRAAVVRLDRPTGSGAVSADELIAAAPPGMASIDALIVNALGHRRFDEIGLRSVWLASDAAQWIIATGAKLLVSDIYESPEVLGIFRDFFAAGMTTVCFPVGLHLLERPFVRLTALPLRVAGVTQLPCRVVAEIDE